MNKILIFSGAGLSADSGISTFRDPDGLWMKHNVDVVCNINTWHDNYDSVHQFYDKIRGKLGEVKPNKMHKELAYWQSRMGEDFEIWTQNVDDLLERSGCVDVKHVHGSLRTLICEDCEHVWDIGYNIADSNCPKCGNDIVKPNVVFFGQHAPMYTDLIHSFTEARKDSSNTIIVIGTSGEVVPLSWIIGNYKEEKEAFKILVDVGPRNVDLSIFDMCMIDKCENSYSNLSLAIQDRINRSLTKETLKL